MNRAQRRAQGKDIRAQIKTQVFNQEKDSLRRHLKKTEAEMRDSLEHVYNGMYFATMAIAMHRCRLSQNTIYKAMSMADDLYGQLFDGKLTADDLEKMVVEEAGIKIEYDADRQYMILRPFERTKDGKKAYYNLTGLMKVQTGKGEEMMLGMTHNIDTIIVNPSEEERVRAAFLANGLGQFADMIVPCIYVAKGQILAYDRERLMHLGFKIGGEEG